MDLVRTASELRARLQGEPSIAFVPTMGNLHAGHLGLVKLAASHGRCVVASIFVNRLQFEAGGDFERYPRTLGADREKLAAAGCHVVFAPNEAEMYPEPQEVRVSPPPVAAELEGAHRPGHFEGVATVVTKLFHMVRPHAAVFGRKDYQQLLVIRALVRQLNFGIEIVGGETLREPDGLAMSSRNGYLTREERAEAPRLNRVLRGVRDAVEKKRSRSFERLCAAAAAELAQHGWKVDYVQVRSRERLAAPALDDAALVVLAAARLGRTRLIDNLEIG
ncbi:MAG TPA: pantoate--beta-alanine ligase [Myxococcota bacterium]|nr:pantoate--beta-alanine ligase [Myxococcota bacterium]